MRKPKEYIRNQTTYYPAISAILIGLSRLPIHLNFLIFIGFIPLFKYFEKNRKFKELLFSGFSFSLFYTIITLHWINLVTVPGFFGIIILFTFYFTILFSLINLSWTYLNKLRFTVFILLWLSFEFLQNFGEFKFPWFNIGYSISEYLWLLQVAEIGGIYFIGSLIFLSNILLYKLKSSPKKYFILLISFFLIWIGYGILRVKTLKQIKRNKKVAVIQPNIPQELKWNPSYREKAFEKYFKLSKQAKNKGADLVILPESAITVRIFHSSFYRNQIKQFVTKNKLSLFTGFPHFTIADSSHAEPYYHYNTASLIDKRGNIKDPYYKNNLVPFGERFPFLDIFPFMWDIHLGQANFTPGKDLKYYKINDLKFSPLICFEIAFPKMTLKMSKANTDFIINITNDAWFGQSSGAYQHAAITRFRAAETRTQIFRSANTGISLIVNPDGSYNDKIELMKEGFIISKIITVQRKSIYVKYLYWLPYFILILSAIFLLFLLLIIMRNTL